METIEPMLTDAESVRRAKLGGLLQHARGGLVGDATLVGQRNPDEMASG